jgi:hypothetical protein
MYPAHVVADWLDNSSAIAERHHLKICAAHFQRATAQPPGPVQNPVQSEAGTDRKGQSTDMRVFVLTDPLRPRT